MVRSLSFIHLFIILAVGYIGGVLLYREIPSISLEKLLVLYDARVIQGHEASFLKPIASMVVLFVVTFVVASFQKTRFLVLFLGALNSVFFGLSSSYLLGSGMKMIEYAVWWFPFQFLACLFFLLYCAVLNPPYFTRTTIGNKRNPRALPVLVALSIGLLAAEMAVYYWILA